jgi:dihydroxyacetone kinase-like predicted kinase
MALVALLSNPNSTGNRAILPRIRSFCAQHPEVFHYEVEDASQIGARGHSGIILSQFFNGLALHHYENAAMDTTHFSLILVNAATSVRAAISAPIDGTMLTMIEVFANTSTTVSKHIGCFNQLMDKLLPTLQATLKASADSIPVLKAAKVVDAGALGFYFFMR